MSDLWPGLIKNTEKTYLDPIEGLSEAPFCMLCEDNSAIDTDGAEVVCTRCGTVLDVPLELGAEFRWYSPESGGGADPSRCGFPINPLLPESSLGTMMLYKNQSALMRRMRRYHSWNMMPYRERTLYGIFDSLQVRSSAAGIGTAVIEEAKELFAQLTATDSCRGDMQRDSMLAACLWEALKRQGSPRMSKDVAEIFNIPLRYVTKGIKQFQHLFAIRTSGQLKDTYAAKGTDVKGPSTDVKGRSTDVKGPDTKETSEESAETIAARAFQRRAIWQKTAAVTTSYEHFIKPFLTNLSAPRGLEAMVRKVCARTEELNIVPENIPTSLTASVIAFCCQHTDTRIELVEIARVCGISTVTIQKCLKRMAPAKEKLLE
jgi:transcription initiation factor TFIIIB Brf1 subunit/transcription initiation factor TFIIB